MEKKTEIWDLIIIGVAGIMGAGWLLHSGLLIVVAV